MENILIVESNETRGRSLGLMLSEIAGYDIVHVRTIMDAIKHVKTQAYDMILTNTVVEQLQDGIKLAQMVLLRQMIAKPPPIVMVTVQRDKNVILASRRVGVVDYILYPYDPEDLLNRIRAVFDKRNGMSGEEVRKNIITTLRKILELPTISAIYNRVEEELANEESTADDVAAVLSLDQSISAKVLRLANSAQFGFNRTVTTVKDAVTMIGYRKIGALVQAATTFEAIGRVEESPNFNRMDFWEHSIGCGAIARVLAEKVSMDPDRAFIAGVMHDVGKVVLDGFFPNYFGQALDKAIDEHISIFEAEKECLPVTHEVVGRYLATLWHLPEPLIEVIGAHNSLELQKEEHVQLVRLVHLADTVCRQMKIGRAGDDRRWGLPEPVIHELNITRDMVIKWKDEFLREVQEGLALLQLVEPAKQEAVGV